MLALIFLALVIYMVSSLIKEIPDTEQIHSLIKKSIKYSGLNKTVYREFIANIHMALEHSNEHIELSRKFMKLALVNLDEIALSTVSGDTNVIEELGVISEQLKIHFEELYVRNEIKRKRRTLTE
tara:strand:- start:3298 stop:3672 length:375 start_codon:yes stop_codon:yes gene_type:complete